MNRKNSSSLKDLKQLREAVLAEERARTEALLQNLSQPRTGPAPPRPAPPPPVDEVLPEEIDPDPDAFAPTEIPESAPEPSFAPTTPDALESRPAPEPPAAPEPSPAQEPPTASETPSSLESFHPAELPVRPSQERPAEKAAAPPAGPAAEAALIIPLTPNVQERLRRHVEGARWSQADLVIELIRTCLHQGYPEIRFEERVLARGGTYRTVERNPIESCLRIKSGQGVFLVATQPENPDYQYWLSWFQQQQSLQPEKSASQICLAALQSYLESVEDYTLENWTKTIPPVAFSVAPMGVNYT